VLGPLVAVRPHLFEVERCSYEHCAVVNCPRELASGFVLGVSTWSGQADVSLEQHQHLA
jgi:hypothetical protein